MGNAGGVDEASTVKHSGNKNNSQGKFSVTSLSAVNQFSKGTSETLSKRYKIDALIVNQHRLERVLSVPNSIKVSILSLVVFCFRRF